MTASTNVLAVNQAGQATIRVAATADIHCDRHKREAVETAFAAVDGTVDLILLAGDLTTHGEPDQAAVLADSCRGIATPVIAVLGNHDYHAGRHQELTAVLEDGGIDVLERHHVTYPAGDSQVGIAGTKGFVGGFRGLGLPDFGEPSLRAIYAETTAEVEALARGLGEIALCPFRIVLLHYAPTPETLHGEPPEIWTFLGSDRLAGPILEHRPDLVLHGHAHSGAFEASLEGVPVHNVSVAVTGRDFWVFELTSVERAPGPIH
jgi:uncharacterized protein